MNTFSSSEDEINHGFNTFNIGEDEVDRGYGQPFGEDEVDHGYDQPFGEDEVDRGYDQPFGEDEVDRGYDHQPFEQCLLCFPVSYIDKHHLEDGNKIIMPVSALERLMDMEDHIEYPMLFEIKNPSSDRVSHCGVLEFSAEEGFVFLPSWMMKNMKLREGDMLSIKNVKRGLPKGEYMKIQPHTMKFVNNLKNPKDVLETVFKDFMCVTAGDTIMITHEKEKYYVDIVETKPCNAISLFETDCEVDFAPALDYKEPEKKPKSVVKWKNEKVEEEAPEFKAFTGVARRLDGLTTAEYKTVEKRNHVLGRENNAMKLPTNKVVKGGEKSDVEKKGFQPFTGKKFTLAD